MSREDVRYTWSRTAPNPVEHVAGTAPQCQPICGTQLSHRTATIQTRPSGLAPLCGRCQTRLARTPAQR